MLGHYIHFLNTLDEDVYVRVLGDTWPFPLIAGPIKLTTKDRTGTPYQPFHQDWGFIVKFTKDKDGFKPLAETKSIRVEKDSWRCALEKKSGGGYKVVVENWEKFYTKIKVLLLYTSALADNVKDFIKKWQKVVKEVNETYFKGYYVEIKFIEGLGELVYNNHFGEEKDWEKNLTAVFMNPGAYGDSSFIKKIRDYINALREPFSADILVLWHNRNIKAGARMRKPWYLEKENNPEDACIQIPRYYKASDGIVSKMDPYTIFHEFCHLCGMEHNQMSDKGIEKRLNKTRKPMSKFAKRFADRKKGLTRISVGNAQNIWGLNDITGEVFKYDGEGWQKMDVKMSDGISLRCLSAGSDGTALGATVYYFYTYEDGKWLRLPIEKFTSDQNILQVSVHDLSDDIWAVGPNPKNTAKKKGDENIAYRYAVDPETGEWVKKVINCNLYWVSTTGNGPVWGVDSCGKVLKYNGTSNTWTKVKGTLFQISGSPLWGVTPDNRVVRYNGKSWTKFNGTLQNISAGADGEVWGLNPSGKIYRLSGEKWLPIKSPYSA